MKVQALLAILLFASISCDQFAVLVAGSNTYENYRHQSDVFHHYHILTSRGVKPQNIIVMAYDDIARNPRNPFPGEIFNSPAGKDVYAGVVIDYFGEDVTPSNFVAVLTGDKSAVMKTDTRTTGKVLTSTSNDNVYIYFSDHGGDFVIAFPFEYLYADELNDALKTMHNKGMYKQLVFYLEACHSGSMFENLLSSELNIYTTTAADPHESSYAEYCRGQARVRGRFIGSCLGDEYSCRFMEDIDSRPGERLSSYSMQQQYQYLRTVVRGSNVQQYGDLTIAQKSIAEFISQTSWNLAESFKKSFRRLSPIQESDPMKNKINNENYRLEWYRMEAEMSNALGAEQEYYDEIMAEGRVTKIFDLFTKKFNLPKRDYNDKIDFDCYREVVKGYEDKCGTLIDRDFKFMTHIANFCTKGINPKEGVKAFKDICE